MPEYFFAKFPKIQYSNSTCVDLTKRVVVNADLRNSPIVFDEYDIKNSSRADIISENYYEDPTMEWMIWMTNGIIDPYYGWSLTNEEFDAHLIKKYGSIDLTLKKIAYFRNNWRNDDRELSPSFYNSQLPANLKKYFTPNFNDGITILSYTRKRDDILVNTNKLYSFNVTLSNTQLTFTVGELVDITTNTAPFTVVGGGEVIFANTSVVKVKNIAGNTSATNLIASEQTNAVATITTSTLIADNIPDDEAAYWEPVYVYDVEYESNEKNKSIQLLNPAYAKELAFNLRTALKQ
jgi:hypothetical protein